MPKLLPLHSNSSVDVHNCSTYLLCWSLYYKAPFQRVSAWETQRRPPNVRVAQYRRVRSEDSNNVESAPCFKYNQFINYAQFNSSVDIPSPRKYAPSTDIVESNVCLLYTSDAADE